jgi:hypothetical protein
MGHIHPFCLFFDGALEAVGLYGHGNLVGNVQALHFGDVLGRRDNTVCCQKCLQEYSRSAMLGLRHTLANVQRNSKASTVGKVK